MCLIYSSIVFNSTEYYYDDESKEDEISGSRNTQRRDKLHTKL
jgi:hypothetical protein